MKLSDSKRFGSLLSVFALIGTLFVGPMPQTQAAVTLPTSVFVPCSVTPSSYCIESVAVRPVGGALVTLHWVPTGSSGPTVSKTEGVVAGRDLPGRCTAERAC